MWNGDYEFEFEEVPLMAGSVVGPAKWDILAFGKCEIDDDGDIARIWIKISDTGVNWNYAELMSTHPLYSAVRDGIASSYGYVIRDHLANLPGRKVSRPAIWHRRKEQTL